MPEIEDSLLHFLHIAEGLKNELRNGRTSTEERESVAEHSWRVSLMVLLFSRFLDKEISLEKALKIAIVHDIAELITGDAPYFLSEGYPDIQKEKFEKEQNAMISLKKLLPDAVGQELFDLWHEYEMSESYEAKLVKATDKIEAQIQHNEMPYKYWNDYDRKHASNRLNDYCSFDSFLSKIKDLVQEESMQKITTESTTKS